ncbi:MAG: hypothetical protein ACFFE8_13745 [Candidatus Heimdallarchaeota archaeon]
MSDYEVSLHYGRLIVILQFVLIPIYFYILSFIFSNGVIWFFDTPALRIWSDVIVYGIGPLVMSFPFLLWTLGRRYQISDAYETFGFEVWRLPTSIRTFYGFNFLIGIIFFFPIITPVLSLFGGYFIAAYLLGWRDPDSRITTQRKTLLLTLLYLPLPLFVILGFYFGFDASTPDTGIFNFLTQLFITWNENIDLLYTSALILADAATIGGVIYFIYEGAKQVDYTVNVPDRLITLLSILIFISLESLFLIFRESFDVILDWIHIGAVVIGILMLILRYWKGLTTTRDTSIRGWLTLVIFQIVNFASGNLAAISQSTAILLAFSIFLFLFGSAYRHASKRY